MEMIVVMERNCEAIPCENCDEDIFTQWMVFVMGTDGHLMCERATSLCLALHVIFGALLLVQILKN